MQVKHAQPPLSVTAELSHLELQDCKVSSGDMSTTCKIHAGLRSHGRTENYTFIAKILPADDPNRVYVFEANVFEKEISIYFELLPCLRQFCSEPQLQHLLATNIPQCVYGSNNMDGAGVLVFECALQQVLLSAQLVVRIDIITRAAKDPRVFTITEKAPTRAPTRANTMSHRALIASA